MDTMKEILNEIAIRTLGYIGFVMFAMISLSAVIFLYFYSYTVCLFFSDPAEWAVQSRWKAYCACVKELKSEEKDIYNQMVKSQEISSN